MATPCIFGVARMSQFLSGPFSAAQSPAAYLLPFMSCKVSAGFPSPADDWVEDRVDLNQRFVAHPENIEMYIDANKVDKIVFNLLSNAFKFTPRGGKITLMVDAIEKDNVLRISLADNGIGVPREKQNLLFSRFRISPEIQSYNRHDKNKNTCYTNNRINRPEIMKMLFDFIPNPCSSNIFIFL